MSAVATRISNGFQPGISGNPLGNVASLSARATQQLWRRAMSEAWDYESFRQIAVRMRDLAIAGDVNAAKFVIDRADPMRLIIQHEHHHTADITNSADPDELDLLAEFRRRKQLQTTPNIPLIIESK